MISMKSKSNGAITKVSTSSCEENETVPVIKGEESEVALGGKTSPIQQQVLSKLSKCDSPYCQGILHTGNANCEEFQRCAICLEDLENKDLALLSQCSHVCCANCIKTLKKSRRMQTYNSRVHHCPLCRQHSHGAIYTTEKFEGNEKEDLFIEHLNCFQNDPHLKEILDLLSPLWRDFVEMLLRERMDFNYTLRLDRYPKKNILYYAPRYIVYKIKGEEGIRTTIFYTFKGVNIQVMLSTILPHFDQILSDDYADEVVKWLKLQMTSSAENLYSSMNPKFLKFRYSRKFEKVHCTMRVQKLNNYEPACPNQGITVDELKSMRPYNIFTYRHIISYFDYVLKEYMLLLDICENDSSKLDVEAFLQDDDTSTSEEED